MYEMRKSAVQQHPHKHIDGRKEMFGGHKLADKDHHKSMGTSTSGRDHRSSKASQIPAGALRVCGEWSEHLSSNGKVYFFNNKSKSSQWERPKEWSYSRAIDVKKDKSKVIPNRVSSKHSTDGFSGSQSLSRQHSKPGYSHSSDAKKLQTQPQNARHRTNHDGQSGKDFRDRDYRASIASSAKDRDYRDIDYRDNRSSDSRISNNVDASRSHLNQDRDYRPENRLNLSRQSSELRRISSFSGAEHNGKSISLPNNTHSSLLHSDMHPRNKEKDGHIQYYREDGSKSSSTTPKSASENSKAARTGSDGADGSESNGNEETSALVQTLSTVLNQANKSTTEDGQESSSLEGNLKNALQMLLTVAAQNQQLSGAVDGASAEPDAEPPVKRARSYDKVDEHINNSLAECQSAEKVMQDLKGLFDERHISHIQGWPAEQMERQSVRLCDENHQFMVNHTSQLSAYMKVSRSQVRTAEIHSTLQEQRILYLRQQMKDLEKSSTSALFT